MGGSDSPSATADAGDCPPFPSGFGSDSGWICGLAMTATLSRSPADVLLVVDRSGSMQDSLAADCLCTAGTGDEGGSACSNTADCADRWTAVKSAVAQIVASAAEIHWGVELFPSPAGSTCSVSPTPQLPVGTDSGAMVQVQLDAITPGGNTPTAAAISAAAAYLSSLPDQNGKAIVLATDGEPSCGVGQPSPTSSDLDATTAAITAAGRAGFRVYVIGAGPSVGDLDTMAKAGGTANYYPATSPEQLSAALSGTSQSVASCTFALPSAPPDAGNVAVYVDKQKVPNDPANGWTYGATTSSIVLTGSYCDQLKVAETTTVRVFFGCSGPPPPFCIL